MLHFKSLEDITTARKLITHVLFPYSEPRGVVIDNALFTEHPEIIDEVAVADLGSPEDLAQLARNPLIRARVTLKKLEFSGEGLGKEGIAAAGLLLAYVELAFQN